MDILAVLLLIVVVIMLMSLKGSLSERMGNLEGEIRALKNLVEESTARNKEPKESESAAPEDDAAAPVQKETYWQTGFKKIEEPEEEVPEEIKSWLASANTPAAEPVNAPLDDLTEEEVEAPEPVYQQAAFTRIPEPEKPSFFERNPDLEKFIGENLVSKIGIGILVLAIGYFVKFAIDNNWIGEIGRVAIGIICGGILVGIAHYMRNSYKAFSSVLVGGGLAVFYFTITLAHRQFHLFGEGQTTAFIIMLVITGFAVALSLLYDRQEVAIIALVGGFAAPFMVSTGSGNYKALFTYLILLNTGLLVMAYYKAWRLLNLLAFIFTVILVGAWLVSLPLQEAAGTYTNGFVFLTIFYLLFFAINIANNIRENKKFLASDFGILLANTSLYFAAGLFCLYNMHAENYKGLFSASMGVFNLGASYILFRNRKIDTNILYLLIGITLTFISLTGPLQLDGNYITLFWASEAVLLYWLFQKSKIAIIEVSSAIVWIAMLISLFMDWYAVYGNSNNALAVLINRGFITTIYTGIASYALFLLKRKEGDTPSLLSILPAAIFQYAAVLLLFIAGLFEIHHQFYFYFPGVELYWIFLELYIFTFALLLLFVLKRRTSGSKTTGRQLAILEICTIIYLLLIGINFDTQSFVLQQQSYSLLFSLGHWISVVLAGLIIYRLIYLFRNIKTIAAGKMETVTWIICIVIIVFLSAEANMLVRAVFYSKTNPLDNVQRLFNKTVLPILWGLSSFAFMWLGMKFKFRTLRIISLVLFSITLLKLFIFDIRNIPVAGKIAAFFSLGVLLLVVSFMYQRLKKIITDDEKKTTV